MTSDITSKASVSGVTSYPATMCLIRPIISSSMTAASSDPARPLSRLPTPDMISVPANAGIIAFAIRWYAYAGSRTLAWVQRPYAVARQADAVAELRGGGRCHADLGPAPP